MFPNSKISLPLAWSKSLFALNFAPVDTEISRVHKCNRKRERKEKKNYENGKVGPPSLFVFFFYFFSINFLLLRLALGPS